MHEFINRNTVFSAQPVLLNSLLALGEAAGANLEKTLVHLVKLRASQINGCGFCLHMYAAAARKDGEQQVRLDVLAAWSEVALFSAREQAALRWTEKLTQLAQAQIDSADFSQLNEHFNQQEIIDLTAIVVTINAWNRVALGFHFMSDI